MSAKRGLNVREGGLRAAIKKVCKRIRRGAAGGVGRGSDSWFAGKKRSEKTKGS